MHSALFVMEDASFISRIKEILNGRFIQCFFACTGEEALAIMESNEIAAAVISLSLPSADGRELAEFLLHKNERLQLMLLFEEADTRRAIYLHNRFSVCGLFCKDTVSFEELLERLEAALLYYNEESKQKRRDDAFREKETNYKNIMFEVSALLNDRMESYRKIIRHFHICGRYLLGMGDGLSHTEYEAGVLRYQEQILEDFVRIYLLREPVQESFFAAVQKKYNHPAIKKYCTLTSDVKGEIEGDTFQNIAFLLNVLTSYFNHFYSEYRGKVTLSQNEQFYLLDILYEAGRCEAMKEVGGDLTPLNEKLISAYAAKAAYGKRGYVTQYKIYFAKPRQEEG